MDHKQAEPGLRRSARLSMGSTTSTLASAAAALIPETSQAHPDNSDNDALVKDHHQTPDTRNLPHMAADPVEAKSRSNDMSDIKPAPSALEEASARKDCYQPVEASNSAAISKRSRRLSGTNRNGKKVKIEEELRVKEEPVNGGDKIVSDTKDTLLLEIKHEDVSGLASCEASSSVQKGSSLVEEITKDVKVKRKSRKVKADMGPIRPAR